MKVAEDYEVLGSVVVEMETALDVFAGVLVEPVLDGERYVLAETVLGTGNRPLRFRSGDGELSRALFEAKLSGAGGAYRATQGGAPL